jgi:hypothetical protein
MALILNPGIIVDGHRQASSQRNGGRAVSSSGDDYAQRLLRYIPVPIAGIYPVLDSAIQTYRKSPVTGLPSQFLNEVVFGLFLVAVIVDIHVAYQKKKIHGRLRRQVQATQTVFSLIAFILWSYTVKGQIWNGENNGGLVIILDGFFLLFANYKASFTRKELEDAGFV